MVPTHLVRKRLLVGGIFFFFTEKPFIWSIKVATYSLENTVLHCNVSVETSVI